MSEALREFPPIIRKRRKRVTLRENIRAHPWYYVMILPGFLFLVMMRVVPSIGSIIAWTDFNIFAGLRGSPWVGWDNFRAMFRYHDFERILTNSLLLGLYKLIFTLPLPIILALLLNKVRNRTISRTVRSLTLIPYLLSWVVVSQLLRNTLHPQSGIVNNLLTSVFNAGPVFFMAESEWFRPVVIISSIWKETGFDSIIYLAALSTIDPQLYDSAVVDGARGWSRLWRITLPSLMPTIVIVFLLRAGRFLEIAFDQVWTLSNPLVYEVSDIFVTYVYRIGFLQGQYGVTTALNVFKAVLSFIVLVICNALAKRMTGRSLF